MGTFSIVYLYQLNAEMGHTYIVYGHTANVSQLAKFYSKPVEDPPAFTAVCITNTKYYHAQHENITKQV